MARPSEGWKLRDPRPPKQPYINVRFRWAGVDYDRSTGTIDPERAAEAAARIYARIVATARRKQPPARPVGGGQLEGAVTKWCASLIGKLDARTIESYSAYGSSHWVPFFGDKIENITSERIEEYTTERLSKVSAKSVRKEHSGLRGFIAWASDPARRLMAPVEIPSLPKKAVGSKYSKRTRAAAIPLSPAEVKKILAALPEWSSSPSIKDTPHPIRARFVVQYETGLRPELLDRLSVPEHYRRGAKELTITPELDKNRWARKVPLSPAAQRALNRVLPKSGVIFGAHRYETPIRRAALAAMPKDPERAKLFTGAHLRSARITHWIDEGGSLTGIQFLVGHEHLETTAGYVRPSERAARSVLKRARSR